MRKRDGLTNPASCMSRARDDEWTFVLLGRDRAAPAAVRAWIAERIRLGKNLPTDPQIIDAEQWIRAVEAEQAQAQTIQRPTGPRDECPGHERGGTRPPCCERVGEYNGYGSDGPRLFDCPRSCSCHD